MAKLTPIVVDYETYWTAKHSLSKMNPMAYVMHPDTEIISCAIKEDTQPTYCVFGEDNVRYALRQIDWGDKLLIAHNNEGFDSMISAWRLGIKPAMWGCTMAMARPHFAKTVGLSLAKLVEHFGIGVKDNSALMNTRGKHLKDFTPDEIRAMSGYNVADTNQCYALFRRLLAMTSKDEMRVIDATIRMLVEPAFVLDERLLRDTLEAEKQRKTDVVMKLAGLLGVDGLNAQEEVTTVLASAPKFSALLESLGAETPMKQSPTDPEKLIPALAKTDQGMLDLQESDNEVVAAAAEARLGVKSTILETRIDAYLLAGEACAGRLPIPTKYCGADTTWRRSGWAFNPLNLPRVSGKLSDALRNSMRAPPGYKVVVADLSGIELRVNLMLWKVPYAMELYAQNAEADLYKPLASEVLGVPIEGMPKMVRQAGKAMHLGCIAEGSEVLTDQGLVAIECVTADMRVWDGVEWVSNDGAIYQGFKEVLTYDSLTATPDHIVYLRDGSSCEFKKAADESLALARTGDGWTPIRAGKDNLAGDISRPVKQRDGDDRVLHLRDRENDKLGQLAPRNNSGVSEMQPAETSTGMVGPACNGDETTLYKSERPSVQNVWGPGHTVSVQLSTGSRIVDHSASGVAERQGTGSRRQQRALRTGESSLVDANAEYRAHHANKVRSPVAPIPSELPGGAICGQYVEEFNENDDRRGNSSAVEPPVVQTKRRVWDILNAGPRNRFTVSGVLVHNCGFGLGSKVKYIAVAKQMAQIDVTEDEAEEHVSGYRRKHPEVVAGWKRCHHALALIDAGVEESIDPWGLSKTSAEGIVTPKGLIRYPALRQQTDDTTGKKEWVYGEGRHKARIYAGKVTENLVQHLARTIVNDHMLEIRRRSGRLPALEVYDELVYVVPDSEAQAHLDLVLSVMRTAPTWWPELVLWAEGDIAGTYGAAK